MSDETTRKGLATRPMTAGLVFLLAFGLGSQSCLASEKDTAVSRAEKVHTLLETIRNSQLRKKDPAQVAAAAVELGNLKATEAIPDLVALLTFEHDSYQHEGPGGYEYTTGSSPIPYVGRHYPATLALAAIGDPTLPALVRAVEEHDEGSAETDNAKYVISVILGRERRKPDQFFREAAARATTAKAKERLLRAASSPLGEQTIVRKKQD